MTSTWVPIANKIQSFDAVSLTVCSSESWPGSFIAETAPSFSIKRYANTVLIWALFKKLSSTNTIEKLRCSPEKQTASTFYITLGSSGSWTRFSFPHNQKHTSLETFFPSESRAAGWSTLMGALLLFLWSMHARARSSGRNAHISSSTLVYVKIHHRKNISETCTNPEVRFLALK